MPDGIKAFRFGSVSEEMMPKLYSAADVFVTPSLQDNLPNTIAEAMSCGTPCVGFNVEGIRFVLSHDMREAAHHKAANAYGETHVAQQYIKLYQA